MRGMSDAALTSCLDPGCGASLAPASEARRYCPACGAPRIVPDPPGSGADGRVLVLGQDVLGPSSGRLYGYRSLEEPPEPIDQPLAPLPAGVRELVAASGSPWPQGALRGRSGQAARGPGAGSGKVSLGVPALAAACRHTRIYVLLEGGSLRAYETPSLVRSGRFNPPRLEGSWLREVELVVGEATLGVACRGADGGGLRLLGLGTGKELDLRLEGPADRWLAAGGELLRIGRPADGRQRLERFGLARLAEGGHGTAPEGQAALDLDEPMEARAPEPWRLGRGFLVAAADGRIWGWGARPQEDPDLLWDNPRRARLRPERLVLGPGEAGYLAEGPGGAARLLRFRAGGEGGAIQFAGEEGLALDPGASIVAARVWQGRLLLCLKGAGGPLAVCSYEASGGRLLPGPMVAVSGTVNAEVGDVQVLPEGRGWRVMVQVASSGKEFWEFHLIDPEGVDSRTLDYRPFRRSRVRLLWEEGRRWALDLSEGELTPL